METLDAPAPRRTKTNYADATDADMVVAALLSDLRAFDELTRRYRAAVIATATPFVRNRTAAEDLAQDVFLTAFFALPQLDDPARFGGWLRVITRRQAQRRAAQEHARHGGQLPLEEERLAGCHAPRATEPEAALTQQEERLLLRASLERLPAEPREILQLYACEDWSLARIAAYLSIEEGTARVRLFRARQVLRRLLTSLHDDPEETRRKSLK